MTPAPRSIIEAFLAPGSTVPLRIVYDAANVVGVEDQTLRLALRRMIGEGLLVQSGRGRSGSVTLSPLGAERIEFDRVAIRLAYAQDHGQAPWDGRWRLIAVSAPESERHARDRIRRTLLRAGAAPASTGLYVTPHDLGRLIPEADRSRLVLASTADLELRGAGDPQTIAEALWPAALVAEGYAVIDTVLDRLDGEPALPVVARQLYLVDAIDRATRDDPLIPADLRADDLGVREARARWLEAWRRTASLPGSAPLFAGWL